MNNGELKKQYCKRLKRQESKLQYNTPITKKSRYSKVGKSTWCPGSKNKKNIHELSPEDKQKLKWISQYI